MRTPRTIKTTIIAALCVLMGAFAHAERKPLKMLQNFEIGFYFRQELGFNASKPVQIKSPCPYFYFRIPLTSHFKVEVSLDRQQYFTGIVDQNNNNSSALNFNKGLTIPMNLQYTFRDPSRKVRPFIGVGSWLNTSQYFNGNATGTDWKDVPSTYRGPNYISVFFTQGVIIEVNTHLQITPAIHMYNRGDINSMEMNVGIGYRLP